MARAPSLRQAKEDFRLAASRVEILTHLRTITPKKVLRLLESALLVTAAMGATSIRRVILAGVRAIARGED